MAIPCLFTIIVLLASCRNKPEQKVQPQPQSQVTQQDTVAQVESRPDTLGIYADRYHRILRDESLYQSPVTGVDFPDPKNIGDIYHKEISALVLPFLSANAHILDVKWSRYQRKLDASVLYNHIYSGKKNGGIGFTEYNGLIRVVEEDPTFYINGKFPTNGEYQFLTGIFDTAYEGGEYSRCFYTYTYDCQQIDLLPSYYTRLGTLLVGSEVLPDLTIHKVSIHVDYLEYHPDTVGYTDEDFIMEPPVHERKNYGDTIIGRRIDSYYQVTPDGRFELRRQLEFPRQEYLITQLRVIQDSCYVQKKQHISEVFKDIPQDSVNARWTLDMDRRNLPPGGRHNRSAADLADTGVSNPDIRFPLPVDIHFDSLFTRRIGWARLPFYADTAGVPPSRWYRDSRSVSTGRPAVDLSEFPSIVVDEFGQSLKTGDPDSLTANFIRLDYLLPSNGNYLLVYGTYGTPREPWWGYYATFDPVSGRLIDHLIAKESGIGMNTLESEISEDLHIRTTQINFLDTYVFSTPGQPLRGQRIDNYYRLTEDGKFALERTERFSVRPYDITELEHTRLCETRETME